MGNGIGLSITRCLNEITSSYETENILYFVEISLKKAYFLGKSIFQHLLACNLYILAIVIRMIIDEKYLHSR